MNVTVFGATGAIGSLTVNELLANGHTVTAYARNPTKIPAEWGDRVRIIVGELSDADASTAPSRVPTSWSARSAPVWTAKPPKCPSSTAPGTSSTP